MLRSFIRALSTGILLGAAAHEAVGQEDFDLWERDISVEATLVLAPGSGDDTAIGEGDVGLFEVSAGGSIERILDSGARIGFRGALRLQKDHAGRPGFAGSFPAGDLEGPRGALTGFALGPEADATGPRGSVESAHVYIEGGYGELSAGRDLGVAARFHEGDVGVFSHARAINPYLDPSGRSLVRTRHDLTGPSAKISYTSPRIIGVRAGLSFTPEAEASGLDRNPRFDGSGIDAPELRNGFELAVNGSRRLRESGIRLRGGLAWSSAESEPPAAGAVGLADRVETVSIGAEAEIDAWRFGLSGLLSDDGLASGDYSAWGAGLAYETGPWTLSGEIGEAQADVISASGLSVSLGAARDIGDSARLAFGYQHHEIDPDAAFGGMTPGFSGRSSGVVVEITLTP